MSILKDAKYKIERLRLAHHLGDEDQRAAYAIKNSGPGRANSEGFSCASSASPPTVSLAGRKWLKVVL